MSDKASIYLTGEKAVIYLPFTYEIQAKTSVMSEREFTENATGKYDEKLFKEYNDIQKKHTDNVQNICEIFKNLLEAEIVKLDEDLRKSKAARE